MTKIDVGLPIRPFLYTLDQISDLLSVGTRELRENYLYFDGVSTGPVPRGRMMARNIGPEDKRPQWRVAEAEFIRWLRHKGFRIYDTSRLRL